MEKVKVKEKINFVLSSMREDFSLQGLDIEINNKTNLLRVFVNRPGEITIDDCAQISKKISVHLDIFDFIPEPYRLEVSSPGTENKEER